MADFGSCLASRARPGPEASGSEQAAAILAERDPVLRRLIAAAGPIQLRPPTESHLASLVRAIVYQQLAGTAAAAIHGRLLAALGGAVTAEGLLALSPETMRLAGLSGAKTASLHDLASKVLDGTVVLDPAELWTEDSDEVVAQAVHRPRHRQVDRGDVPHLPAAAAGRMADR